MLLSPATFTARPCLWVSQGRTFRPAVNFHSGGKVSATTTGQRLGAARQHSPGHAQGKTVSLAVVAVAAPASGVGAARGRRGRATAPAPAPPMPAGPQGQAGSLFGAIALITGSTVGAGMLALPEVTAPAGIVPTAVSLTATWVLLTLDALLIAEVNLAARAARDVSRAEKAGEGGGASSGGAGRGIVTLRQMAEFSLGKAGKSEPPLSMVCCPRCAQQLTGQQQLAAFGRTRNALLASLQEAGLPPHTPPPPITSLPLQASPCSTCC